MGTKRYKIEVLSIIRKIQKCT